MLVVDGVRILLINPWAGRALIAQCAEERSLLLLDLFRSSARKMSVETLLSRPKMKAYATARLALGLADQNLAAEFAVSDGAFAAHLSGGHHAVAIAAFRWLCAVLHEHDGFSDFSVVSATQLLLGKPTPHAYSMALADGSCVECRLHPQRTGKAAGGRTCIDKVSPAIQKKGPDSWKVDVQMCTPSVGSTRCVLGVMLDIFWRVSDPVKHHNQFRVTQCSDLDGLQQWCRSAGFAATLATAPAAEAADPPLTVATGWDCYSGSLECAGSAVPEACMHTYNVDPGLSGNLASVNAPQHEGKLADLAMMFFDDMPGDDEPSASLSHEGASVTVQSAPSNSAPTAKRVRSNSSGPDSSSQPTVSLACHNNMPRCFKQIIVQPLDTQAHYSTIGAEDLTKRLQSLELNVSGVHVTLKAHDDKLDRLHGQIGEHTEDLIDVQVELATRQGLHNAARAMPGGADNVQSCSSDIHHPVGNSSFPSPYDQSASNQADASHATVTLPYPRPHHRAPTPHTPSSASTVSCPPFNGSLTHAQLRPAIVRALEIHKPNSRSALDLSKMLWPEDTPMRAAMNTMVKGVLYSDEMASKVERNGTHWALKD